MEASELIQRVRRIEIKTRRLSNNVLSGEYHSSFKGRGMAFSEVRHYQMGDDIRSIDWNVTARKREPFIKVFEEERERTLMLLIDVSGSENFGTKVQTKAGLATEVAATLAFSAIQNNDKVGVIFFTDIVEKFIPPRKGRQHILTIIRELIEIRPRHTGTNISAALEYLSGIQKKRAITMILSDFMDSGFEHALKVAGRKHEVTAVHLNDPGEWELPSMGIIPVRDAETGEMTWINSSSRKQRNRYREQRETAYHDFQRACNAAGIGHVRLQTDEDFAGALLAYFKSSRR